MKIFYYSGTHWDREWYQTFQGFRKRLVDMLDGTIEGLEKDPEYGVFHLDGQTIALEDYLEIRPEMKDRLTALIQKGKIVIGPWYVMPDEFLLSGESLIKNLRKGMQISREYGVEPAHNAYICDIFGHASQTPQIFAGMNLHNTILGRGTNDYLDPAHFVWEALDGSQVITFALKDMDGYGDFCAFAARHPSTLPQEEFDAAIKAYVDEEIKRSEIPVVILMDALDHQHFRADTPRYLEALRRIYPDAEIYHCSIDEFDEAQKEYKDQLKVYRGEICKTTKNNSSYNHLITHTLSSRYPLKRYNDINQMRLEKWAAPLYALKKINISEGFLRVADKYLLQNHPHDSICGCSIDQVHRDMQYRFDQTSLLCDEMIRPFHTEIAAEPDGEKSGWCLRVYNPLPYRGKRTIVAQIETKDMPYYWEHFCYQKVPAFRLYDSNGQEIVYGCVKPLGKKVYEIAFSAELTPCAVTEFYVAPAEMPTRQIGSLLTDALTATGDAVSVTVNANGTVDMTDLQTGEVYKNLLTLLDNGEIGDGWNHCPPIADHLVTQTTADVIITENNAVRTTFRITQKMQLPREMNYEKIVRRSEEMTELKVVHDVTVAKEDRGITVHTCIDNTVKDHRLRLRLPQTVVGDTYEASQAFGYVTRKCGDDPTTADWKEYGCVEKSMSGICAKREADRGLAFVSAYGLHECGVWPNGDMDITLFRACSRTIRTDGEPDGQLQQRLEYCYRILPYTAKDHFADLQKEQDFLSVGVDCTTVKGDAAAVYEPALVIGGRDIVYSTVAPLDDGAAEVRVFNDSENEAKAEIRLPAFAQKASLIELDGRHIADLQLENGCVRFDLPAFRIATVKFE